MTPEQHKAAATAVAHPDIDMDDAYAIQGQVVAAKVAANDPVIGWKIGLTSRAMQQALNIDIPDSGVLTRSMQFATGATIPSGRFIQPRVEAEIAFVMGADIGGADVTRDDVLAATDYVAPSLEILDTRILRWVGAIASVNGTVEETGLGAGVLNDPVQSVVWLARRMALYGNRIKAGQVILSGSFIRPIECPPGTQIHADFGDFGSVSLDFA
jgi:2-oxo-hept-3-ene-1,7-dioate hydratase